jgi:pimeloyl-ACP methyl ester carboxylesterase
MKSTLLCLHGWGGTKESFTELREALKGSDVTLLIPDLPGFGDEPEPKKPWTIDDYADWVETYLKAHSSQPISIVAHSHGGRIAIKLAVRGTLPIDHLYLCAAAGIRHPRHIKRIIGLLLAKTGKIFLSIPGFNLLQPYGKKFLYRMVRVHDYEQASPVMRDTLIRVTQEDLRPLLPFIEIPTDIFWGTEDAMTPVSDAYLMHKKIRDSKLHLFQGVRHRVHRDKAKEIAEAIQRSLKT